MLIASWAAFFVVLLLTVIVYFKISDKSLATGLASLFVAVIALLLAAISTHVAIKSYRDAQESGKQQQAVLEGSRDALAGVVKTLNQQQAVLEKNLKAAEGLYQVVNEQWKTQLDLQRRKPVIRMRDIEFYDRFATRNEDEVDLVLEEKEDSAHFSFSLQNIGNAAVVRPKVLIASKEANVSFQCSRTPPPEVFLYSCFLNPDVVIVPASQARLWVDFDAVVKIPSDVEDFTISFKVWGDNLKVLSREAKVHVLRRH